METFLWGLVKSVPTPTQSAARRLAHPVLTPVPAPPAQPLLLSKPISLLLSMWFAEARHSWLPHTLAALPPHPWSPNMQVGDKASGNGTVSSWSPQISNRTLEHLQDHSLRAWMGRDHTKTWVAGQ